MGVNRGVLGRRMVFFTNARVTDFCGFVALSVATLGAVFALGFAAFIATLTGFLVAGFLAAGSLIFNIVLATGLFTVTGFVVVTGFFAALLTLGFVATTFGAATFALVTLGAVLGTATFVATLGTSAFGTTTLGATLLGTSFGADFGRTFFARRKPDGVAFVAFETSIFFIGEVGTTFFASGKSDFAPDAFGGLICFSGCVVILVLSTVIFFALSNSRTVKSFWLSDAPRGFADLLAPVMG